MSSSASSLGLSKKASSRAVLKKPKASIDPDLLGFDLLFQLTHLSCIAAAGMTRSRMFARTAGIPSSTAFYFAEVERVARSMNLPYPEACRIVGEVCPEQDIKNLLLRFSSAMQTGERESDFLKAEAALQADVYGNVYERKLETLKKWTDAFTALIMSSALIIVVATVSTMIYDLGTTFVIGLVVAMMGISALGVWIIFRSSPREIKTLRGKAGEASQRRANKVFTVMFPGAIAGSALLWLLGVDIGFIFMAAGVMVFPIGWVAMSIDKSVARQDADLGTFLRVLGNTMTAIGTTPAVAISRMDLRSMQSLAGPVKRLRERLMARVSTELAWGRFVQDTGSELASRTVQVFVDGVTQGGDAEEVGRRASLMALKVNELRAKRKLVAGSFTYLALAMHVVVVFLLVFILEIVSGFNGLMEGAASAAVPGGPSASLGSIMSFNVANLALLRMVMTPVVLTLSVVSALAPKIADGGYSRTLFWNLALTLFTTGMALAAAPILSGKIFGTAGTIGG